MTLWGLDHYTVALWGLSQCHSIVRTLSLCQGSVTMSGLYKDSALCHDCEDSTTTLWLSEDCHNVTVLWGLCHYVRALSLCQGSMRTRPCVLTLWGLNHYVVAFWGLSQCHGIVRILPLCQGSVTMSGLFEDSALCHDSVRTRPPLWLSEDFHNVTVLWELSLCQGSMRTQPCVMTLRTLPLYCGSLRTVTMSQHCEDSVTMSGLYENSALWHDCEDSTTMLWLSEDCHSVMALWGLCHYVGVLWELSHYVMTLQGLGHYVWLCEDSLVRHWKSLRDSLCADFIVYSKVKHHESPDKWFTLRLLLYTCIFNSLTPVDHNSNFC